MMKRSIVVIFLTSLILLSCFLCRPSKESESGKASAISAAKEIGSAPKAQSGLTAVAASPEDAMKVPPQLPAYSCGDSKCDSKINGAKYEKEAKWLLRNGYPSESRLERLRGMSIDQLLQLAGQGDHAARSIAGDKLIAAGKTSVGIDELHRAMFDGSVYASYVMAHAYLSAEGIKNPVEAASYYRLAYLQGDWKASGELYRRVPELDSMQREMVDQRAMRLLENITRLRRQKGIVVPVSVRPMSYDS